MFGKYICAVLDRGVRGSSIVVKLSLEANLFLAAKLQSELIIRAIL